MRGLQLDIPPPDPDDAFPRAIPLRPIWLGFASDLRASYAAATRSPTTRPLPEVRLPDGRFYHLQAMTGLAVLDECRSEACPDESLTLPDRAECFRERRNQCPELGG
jgi:hypothetical protein